MTACMASSNLVSQPEETNLVQIPQGDHSIQGQTPPPPFSCPGWGGWRFPLLNGIGASFQWRNSRQQTGCIPGWTQLTSLQRGFWRSLRDFNSTCSSHLHSHPPTLHTCPGDTLWSYFGDLPVLSTIPFTAWVSVSCFKLTRVNSMPVMVTEALCSEFYQRKEQIRWQPCTPHHHPGQRFGMETTKGNPRAES